MTSRRPRTPEAWHRMVESTLRTLTARQVVEVPVGGMVLWPTAATIPPRWLRADGSSFPTNSDDETLDETYPALSDQLGGATTLPNPASVSGYVWLIRAG